MNDEVYSGIKLTMTDRMLLFQVTGDMPAKDTMMSK